jgi:hypothetical protein
MAARSLTHALPFALLLLAACSRPPEPPLEPDPSKNPPRAALDRRCGKCHRSDLESAIPAALAIFDLVPTSWETRVTDDHLRGMRKQMDGSFWATAEEKAAVSAFIEAELGKREQKRSGVDAPR